MDKRPETVSQPDPSVLTTEQLDRAISNLKTLIDVQIASIQNDFNAFRLDHDEKHRSVVHSEIEHRRELSEAETQALRAELLSRLDGMDRRYDERFAEQRTAVSAALTSSTRAVQEAAVSTVQQIKALSDITDSKFITHDALLRSEAEKTALALGASNQAIGKAEKNTEKRLDLIADQINELKTSDTTRTGVGMGRSGSWGHIMAAVSLAATVLGVIIVIANVLTG